MIKSQMTRIIITIILITSGVIVLLNLILNNNVSTKNSNELGNLPSKSTPTVANTLEEYISDGMDLTIQLRKDFDVKDQTTRLLISNESGLIIITREGTQFETLDLYISNLNQLNKLKDISSKDTIINSFPAKMRFVEELENNHVFKSNDVLVQSRIYSFTTEDKSLYDDLDQIAQSFKYTPN